MNAIMEFFKSDLAQAILMSLWLLIEYWMGKTSLIKAGSTLELVLNSVKKLLEMLGIKKPTDDGSLK